MKIGILHWIIISYIYIFSVFLKLKIDSLHLYLCREIWALTKTEKKKS